MGGGDSAGGSRELVDLINRHGECLVSDLKRYYNVDLHDVLVDGSGVSPRLILSYTRSLPVESATVVALRGGDQFRGWDHNMYMLANILDAVRENTHAFVSANSKKRVQPPEPVERPEKKTKAKKANLFATMMQAAWNKGNKQDGGI